MATAKITLIGFKKFLEFENDDLFEYLQVPSGLDKQLLINTILMNGAEFEVLYSDPYFMKDMISVWSSKWMHTMERWLKAVSIDYEPLENYDRKEEWLDVNQRKGKTERNETAIGHDDSTSSGSGNTTNSRSAFDASDYSPHDKSDSSSSGSNTSSSLTTANGTINEDESGSNQRIGRAHGNIGVTTSQQMLESELEIARWNLYDEIADLFLSELTIYTY